MNVSLVY